jgi:3-oxoacyl-(acyl-carrier-protein) synthase
MTRVLVTGMGIVTAIGHNLAENHSSLQLSRSGIGPAKHFQSYYTDLLPFGEVSLSNEVLRESLGSKAKPRYTRTTLLAIKAFDQAILDAGLSVDELSAWDTALISASTVGGMCLTDQLYDDANLRSGGSEFIDSYGCAAHTLDLVEKYRIRGFTDTINTACSSSANAIMLGARLLQSGRAKRVVVGGVDSLAKYTVNGFNALKILSSFPCKPFDENRDGLNLGEGAAYLVLETEETARDKRCHAEVLGYGNSNDAHHPSAMSDDAVGAMLSMQQAIDFAGIQPSQIDYVNVHGTGTGNNDLVETYGLSRIFENVPPYSSTKSFTGHTLGAAGAVEAVFSILSLQHSEIYASLRVDNPIQAFSLAPVLAFTANVPVRFVLSNSFGFGGNCSSLVFGRATF